jgi:hypothetical protein
VVGGSCAHPPVNRSDWRLNHLHPDSVDPDEDVRPE